MIELLKIIWVENISLSGAINSTTEENRKMCCICRRKEAKKGFSKAHRYRLTFILSQGRYSKRENMS